MEKTNSNEKESSTYGETIWSEIGYNENGQDNAKSKDGKPLCANRISSTDLNKKQTKDDTEK